jgi:hypothetical protein
MRAHPPISAVSSLPLPSEINFLVRGSGFLAGDDGSLIAAAEIP